MYSSKAKLTIYSMNYHMVIGTIVPVLDPVYTVVVVLASTIAIVAVRTHWAAVLNNMHGIVGNLRTGD
jgi:hypothetical protein